jgi:polar amino acid transport system permease protein
MSVLLSHKGKSIIKRSDLIDVFQYVAVIIFIIWLMSRGTERLGYNWQWYQVPKYLLQFENGKLSFGPLMSGLMVTFIITALGLVLSMAIGLLTALLRLSESFFARIVARVYLEVIRNTPLLVQIFFLYFVLAPIFGFSRFAAGVIALSLFEGAYASEIFRAGIVSIQKGQWEASYSLGLRSLIKDSALVSTIAIYDLTMQGRVIIAETFLTFEIWFTIAFMYLIVTIALSILVNYLEARFRIVT